MPSKPVGDPVDVHVDAYSSVPVETRRRDEFGRKENGTENAQGARIIAGGARYVQVPRDLQREEGHLWPYSRERAKLVRSLRNVVVEFIVQLLSGLLDVSENIFRTL